MNSIIYLFSFLICVSANNNTENSSEINNTSNQLNNTENSSEINNISNQLNNTENSSEIKIKPEILYQKRLRNLNNIPDTYKTVTSYQSPTNEFFIEILTKLDHFGNPIYSESYRMPDKIILTPYHFKEVIEFISSSIKGSHKNLGNSLYISRFDNPYHVTLWRAAGLSNKRFRILLFDWLEVKDLISISSNILYDTYNFIL